MRSAGIDITKRTIGLNFNDQANAEIVVWAPLVNKVDLKIKDQKLTLSKDDFGYWSASSNEIRPGSLYKFIVDGEEWPDPASLSQPKGVHDFSEAADIKNYQWNDKDWTNLPLDEYIIYELHTGTFSPDGNFKGIEEKLDHLKQLGITAIELMPVAQFPGNRNWGYDGVYPFAVQHSYGGAEGLQKLVDACHQKGIAVILDVVYNHLGPEGNYFGLYGPYFTDKYNTPWGKAINFDDVYCDAVRQYFIENALMWFRDFHIDALRMDAVHAIKDFSPVHILKEIKQYVDQLMQATGQQHYLIVELDLNDNRFINPTDFGGYGMDAQWIDEFHHALRVSAGGERTGYYEDFNGLIHLAKAYRDAYVYDGQYSHHRKKNFGVKADINSGQQFIIFSQNHDQVGNRMLGERTSQLISFEMQKLLAGAVLIAPYLPMLFMGEEWSEPNPFQYFVSHTDPELAEAVRKGRKEEFAAFHAQGEAPDPVSEETFERSKLQWNLLTGEPYSIMLRYYQNLITLRKAQPVLKVLNRKNIRIECHEEEQVLSLHRWHDEQAIICFLNFSASAQYVKPFLSIEGWSKLWDSADLHWSGPEAAPSTVSFSPDDKGILLQPESLLIYASRIL